MSMRKTVPAPSKEQIRDWMRLRRLTAGPLPGAEQIRRELGWGRLAESTSSEEAHQFDRGMPG